MLSPLQSKVGPDLGEPRSVFVVVPSYKHAKFIERTLRSIFAQTLQPKYLLVIDDGSTDDSPAIIERVLKDAPFPAELISRPNRGLSATLNQALGRTAGGSPANTETSHDDRHADPMRRNAGSLPACDTRVDNPATPSTPDSRLQRFFAYLGSDDIWLPNFLERRVALLQQRPNAVLAYGNAYSIDAKDRIIDCSVDWAHYTDGDARRMLLDGIAPLSPTVLYRRSAIEDLTWNENSRLEDYEFYLRLSVRGEFAYDPEILSAWRQHGANTSEGSLMMMEEKISALERTAPLFDLSPADVDQLIRLARFRGAQELMRRGHKKAAMKFGLSNLTAAKSLNEATRFLAGLATPTSTLRSRRQRYRTAATAKYGSLEDRAG
jgi:alpha-1,3-rhamnosyltransferase